MLLAQMPLAESSMFKRVIPSLAPEVSIMTLFNMVGVDHSSHKKFTIDATCNDVFNKAHTFKSTIDLNVFDNIIYTPPASELIEKRIVDSLEKVAKLYEKSEREKMHSKSKRKSSNIFGVI